MSDLHSEIVNTTQALIIVVDVEGYVTLFNPACERLSGYRAEEMRGTRNWTKLVPQDELKGVYSAFTKLREGQFPSTYKNHWVTKAGESRLIEWSTSAVTDDRGRVSSIIATGIDMTERAAAQKALRDAERRQRVLLDSLPDAAWLKDKKGVFLELNWGAAERCGRDRTELIGKTAAEFMPRTVAERWAEQEREAMATGSPWRGEESRPVGGQTRWFSTLLVPVIGDKNQVIGTAGVSRDVTDARLHEAQREAHNARLREALVREIHHRIKNSLQGAVSLTQQLADEHPQSAAVLEVVTTRLNAIASVHGLYGALGAQEPRVDQVVMRLVSSLKEISSGMALRVSAPGVPADVLVATGEVLPLVLILNELVWNAVKHTGDVPKGDAVEVVVGGAEDRADIVIRSPCGRLPPDLDFEAGTGLGTGLSLVKALLPPEGATLRIRDSIAGGVRAELTLRPPVIRSGAKTH